MQYYANQNSGDLVRRVILSGGAVLLPGLVAQASTQLGVEILVADAFATLHVPSDTQLNTPTAYGVVVGLMQQNGG